ncbi:MAG: hypothetical protein ACRDKI_04180 [Solirubrobacterales bacterium]
MNSRSRKSSFVIALAAVLALAISTAVAQASSSSGSTKKGASWIAKTTKKSLREFPGQGFRADAVSALAAARKSGAGTKKSADDALVKSISDGATDYATSAGASAKLALAAVASGSNPQCFGGIDLFAQIDSFYELPGRSKGQYGTTAFDQALAMLALKAMHHKVPSAAVKFVRTHRGANGWNFALSTSKGDDTESTGLLIEAMRAAGVSKSNKSLKAAFKWMFNQQNSQGGYNPTDPTNSGAPTQANTTAYAIRAGDVMGKNLKKAKAALRALQNKQGWFRNDSSSALAPGQTVGKGIATSDSVIALSGLHYPVSVRKSVAKSCAQ